MYHVTCRTCLSRSGSGVTSKVGSYKNLTGTVSRSGSTYGRNTRVSMNQLIHFSTPGRNVISPPYTLMLKLKEGISTNEICTKFALQSKGFAHIVRQKIFCTLQMLYGFFWLQMLYEICSKFAVSHYAAWTQHSSGMCICVHGATDMSMRPCG